MLETKQKNSHWNHSNRDEFVGYYAKASLQEETNQRFNSLAAIVERHIDCLGKRLEVADIGCGAGSQSLMWAQKGHRVHALDVSEKLIELGKARARDCGVEIDFQLGSAAATPWPIASMDICFVPELLEHVREWSACLDEFSRIIRPGGALLITTTNKLCPKQQEFDLPLYSWYPGFLKRYYERLAFTTRPEIAGHATYPAVNWFSFYSLKGELSKRGFRCFDRFDVMDVSNKGALVRLLVSTIRAVPALRLLTHIMTPNTLVLAIKQSGPR